jgi:hypothetical protein
MPSLLEEANGPPEKRRKVTDFGYQSQEQHHNDLFIKFLISSNQSFLEFSHIKESALDNENILIEKKIEYWHYLEKHRNFIISKAIFHNGFNPNIHQAFINMSKLANDINSLIFLDVIIYPGKIKNFFNCLNVLTSLTSLSFINTTYDFGFSKDHFDAIGNYLLNNPKITNFKMSNFQFGTKGFDAILKAVTENNTMLFLHFENCKMTDENLKSLLNLTNSKLKLLDLTGLNFTYSCSIYTILKCPLMQTSEAKISLKACTHSRYDNFSKKFKALTKTEYKHLQSRFEL